jgi:hypothetical protein
MATETDILFPVSANCITTYPGRIREYTEPTPVWTATANSTHYNNAAVAAACYYETITTNPRDTAKIANVITSELIYKEHVECCLCLDDMYNKQVSHTPCGHAFHSECLSFQLSYQEGEKRQCAECRLSLYEAAMHSLPPANKVIKFTEL